MTVKFGLAPLSNKHLSDSSLPCLAATKDKEWLQDNIAELIHHVAMSGNSDYETMLFAYVKSLLQKDTQLKLKLLFQLVRDYNSYNTLELILTLTSCL
jgi:hypothetical protein